MTDNSCKAMSKWEMFVNQTLFGDQTWPCLGTMFDRVELCLIKFERRQTLDLTL